MRTAAIPVAKYNAAAFLGINSSFGLFVIEVGLSTIIHSKFHSFFFHRFINLHIYLGVCPEACTGHTTNFTGIDTNPNNDWLKDIL
jgi:hypothetical protein